MDPVEPVEPVEVDVDTANVVLLSTHCSVDDQSAAKMPAATRYVPAGQLLGTVKFHVYVRTCPAENAWLSHAVSDIRTLLELRISKYVATVPACPRLKLALMATACPGATELGVALPLPIE